jgi:geranylgeranyl diphosphate synthase, type II
MNIELREFFDRVCPAIDASLDTLLPPQSTSPSQIHEAMRYSVFSGGKRLRPALCVAGFSVYQDDWAAVLEPAAAIEMIHTYSLIHDDLPAMDDDDFRRGRPSCHRQFSEAIAILAGDGLLTYAFETIGNCKRFRPEQLIEIIGLLGQASGTRGGMIAGQVLDLEAEGQEGASANVESIHRAKTAALIGVSVSIGAYLGGAAETERKVIRDYGECIGLAFQIVDDILDELEGKGRDQDKATYPKAYGLDKSREIIRELTTKAGNLVEPLGRKTWILGEIARFLETRST